MTAYSLTLLNDPIDDDEYMVLEHLLRDEAFVDPASPSPVLLRSTSWPSEQRGYLLELLNTWEALQGRDELVADFLTKNERWYPYRSEFLRASWPLETVPLAMTSSSNGWDRFNNHFKTYRPLLVLSRVGFTADRNVALVSLEKGSPRRGYYILERTGEGWAVEGAMLVYW